ncbi:polyketide synthase [Fusarium sporotrichioides]|uniref:Polyketide synthase n=1 Tax=Fusarium sporotrichioides TaxID=5514 RepID=A0A395RNQ1_FUSSP|nr:polyketide synthase [Fusarium sporotrichioides]
MAARRVVLFGGQGSRSIFSSCAASTAEQDAQSTTAGSIFLSKCHVAFLRELASLDVEHRQILAIDPISFTSPGHLLQTAEKHHTHPVLQATTIYVCQILRYLSHILQQNDTFDQCFERIEGVAGFSSGIVPAAVVAVSSTTDEFIACAVEGFRLAFWVAHHSYRYTLFCEDQDGRTMSQDATMSLATRGLSREQVEQVLKKVETEYGLQRMAVSSIAISGSVSISGPEVELITLQRELQLLHDVTTTFAYVHGWYHGGEQLEPISPTSTVDILSFGPASPSIFPSIETQSSRIRCVDMSSFKADRGSAAQHSIRPDDIAIVGMSLKLPKGQDTAQLWETLSSGLNAVQEIPESRFELSDYYTNEKDRPRSMATRYGAFLDDPFSFDNAFFNISPREAKSMDPQQRILLHAAQEAIEDAGYVADSTPSSQRVTTGCYVGLATGDYTDNLRDDIDTFYPSGTLRAFHSGRISYFYRLSGPSIVTDTACSSSTVSIYQACRGIQNGDCTIAIAGGVNVITSPDMYLGLSRGHFLSPTGNCKPFDASADGYCRAEGCVLFVLKRLSDAVVEGDRIHGVIRNAQINQSGNSSSITHPHSPTQTDLLRRLLKQVNVEPASISVIEAHGTGTQAGDAREVETLKLVFGQHRSAKNPLVVSSIKGNIGHCEAASGAAGLAKLLLMLRNNEIPRQAGLKNMNPALGELQSFGLVVPRQNMPWSRSRGIPRRAVLNNFGAAGSNASILLEEWLESPLKNSWKNEKDKRSSYVFNLSAKSNKALKLSLDRHIETLKKRMEGGKSLQDMCYTATARRQQYDHRISVTCSSEAELIAKLEQHRSIVSRPAHKCPSTILVFTGQGCIYSGMGRELMATYPPFRDIIKTCDRIIQDLGLGCPSIVNYILPGIEDGLVSISVVEHLMVSQCACVALEYALAKMFISWGIKPDYVMGHSLGEYAALCISAILTLEDTFRLVATRAKMMGEHCAANTSGMLACHSRSDEIQAIISEDPTFNQLSIACFNGPRDCVVGGPLSQLEAMQRRCKIRNMKSKLIDVPYAFHTLAMDPVIKCLSELGESVKLQDPTIPLISNVDGQLFCKDTAGDYFANHTRQPVRFYEGIINLQDLMGQSLLGDPLFIEIGPQPALLPMLRDSIASTSCTYLSTLQKGRDAWTSLSQTLSTISLFKMTINWREVFAGTSAQVTDLPGHPLEGIKFCIPFKEPKCDSRLENAPATDLLTRIRTGLVLLPWTRTDTKSPEEKVFETDMTTLGPLITGHDVGGTPICPASVFHEIVLEAANTTLKPGMGKTLVVTGMNFSTPLIYLPSSASDTMIRVHISKQDIESARTVEFYVKSSSMTSPSESMHCSGYVGTQSLDGKMGQWTKDHALITRQTRLFSGASKDLLSTFRTRVLYENIFTRVVRYSGEYQTLQSLDVADSNLEGMGSFRLPFEPGIKLEAGYVAHPVFTDTLLHAAGFIANLAIGSKDIGICSAVESIEVAYHKIDYQDNFRVYCSLLEIKGAILADSFALDSFGNLVAVIRGMEFRKLQLSTFQQALSRISSIPESKRPEHHHKSHSPVGLQVEASATRPEQLITENMLDAHKHPEERGMSPMLRDVVVEVAGFSEQDIDYTMSLADLGIDSLMQIEIVSKISRLFPGQNGLSHHAISECETLEELDDMLSSVLQRSVKQSSASQTSSSQQTGIVTPAFSNSSVEDSNTSGFDEALPVILHTSEGTRTPLCLFHDGSGQISMYKRIRDHDRSTYAFFDPKFEGFGKERSFYLSVEDMTENYVLRILSTRPLTSSLILCGWSFGGVVAFEAARLLSMRGIEVKGLVLIDSPSPINHEPLPFKIISSIISSTDRPGSTSALEDEFLSNASLLGRYSPERLSLSTGKTLKTVVLQSQDTLDTEALYGVRYDWLSRQDVRDAAIMDWEKLVGGPVTVLPIAGNHFEPFIDDNVCHWYPIVTSADMLTYTTQITETASQLWKACQYIDKQWEE